MMGLALAFKLAYASTPGFDLPTPCPPNMSCGPGIPTIPVTPPGTCGPGPGGPTCGSGGPASLGNTLAVNIGAGNPINVITGNKYQREVDMEALPGVLGLEIVRHYNSAFSQQNHSTNLFGRGWKLSYETQLHPGATALQVVQADGTRIIFSRDPRNPSLCASANPGDGTVEVITTARGAEYRWRWPNGRELRFDTAGRLVQILAPGGQFLSMQHDRRGLLVKVTDPQGRSLHLHYPDQKSPGYRGVQRIDSPVGQFSYAYGSPMPRGAAIDKAQLLANLVKVGMPGGARYYHYEHARFPTLLTGISVLDGSAPGQWQRIATYGYDENGKGNLTVKGAPARLARGADGLPLRPAVLAAGTGVEQVTLDSSVGGRTTISNSLGQKTVYRHAIVGGQFRLLEVRGAGCATCGESNVRYGYDDLGRLITTTRLDSRGLPIETIHTDLDSAGRPVKVSKTAYRDGKPGPARWKLRYEYAGSNTQPSLVARPSVSPGKEMQTRIGYNDKGQVISVIESGWSPAIDTHDQARAIVRSTSYRYATINGRSLLTGIAGPVADAKGSVPANANMTRFEHDRHGNHVIAIHAPGNLTTRITRRDEAGRPVDLVQDDGRRLLQTQSRFTPQGHLQAVVETAWLLAPGAGAQPARRDDASRLERKLDAAHEGTAQRAALRQPAPGRLEPVALAAAMDAQFVPESQLRRGEPGSSAEREVLEILRLGQAGAAVPVARRWLDDFGRLAAIQYQGQGVTRASYAAQGPADRIERLVDPLGVVTQLRYNAQGRVETLSRTGADGKPAERIAFRYAGSQLVEQARFLADSTQPDSRISTSYNAFGQITREVTYNGTVALAVNHEYDSAGRMLRTWITQGAGHRALSGIRMRYQDGAGSQLASIEAGDGWFGKRMVVQALQWLRAPAHPDGREAGAPPVLTAWRYGNGLQAQASFDAPAGPATWRLRAYHDGTHPYAVDSNSAGHLNALRQGALELNVSGGKAPRLLPQAQAAALPAAAPGLALPAASGGTGGSSGLADATVQTDAAGRRLVYHGDKGSFDLAWDSAGNLVAARQGGADVARYRYDAQGRRIAKLIPGHPERDRLFLYSGKQLLAEADRDGVIVRQYVYVGWRPVAWVEPARTLMQRLKQALFGPALVYLHTDPRGAVTAGTDEGRAVLWDANVDPNGNAVHAPNAREAIEQPLRLVNQYADAETGLSYNLARYYDPRSGNFLSPDPAGLGSGSLDLYAYAGGDPLNYVDPDAWAAIQYFAIDSGAKVGPNLQPDAGRWAFIITGIAGHLDQAFIYDRGGSYLAGGKPYELRTQAPGTSQAAASFASFYAGKNGYYSPAAFTVAMSDADASGLIESLTGVKLGNGVCPANLNSVLPGIPLGVQGTLTPTAAFTADPNRLISCPAGTSANDILLRRIQKAIEIHEVKAPGTIATDKDCSSATYLACAAGTWNPALKPGTTTVQPASYGWTQFTPLALVDALNGVSANDLTTLGITNAQRVDLNKKVAGVTKWYGKLVNGGSPVSATVVAGWEGNKDSFIADTGLSKVDYDRMQSFGEIGATLKQLNDAYKGPPASCKTSKCFWDKWQADDPAAKAALLKKAETELGATQTRLNPYIRDLKQLGEGRAGFQWAAIISSPIGQSLLSALADKKKADILAKAFLDQKMKQARTRLNLTGNNNLTAAQELLLAKRILLLQNGSETYAPKVLPHLETTFCVEGSATSTNGYLRMDQLKVYK